MVLLEADEYMVRKKRTHLFCFEECWTKDARCEELIGRSWRNTSGTCHEKIKALQKLDVDFEDYQIGNIRKEIKSVEEKLNDPISWDVAIDEIERVRELEKRHAELLQLEETIWRQRSRAVWLKEGDKNTKFFHGKASQRKKINEIVKSTKLMEVQETCEVVKDKLSVDHREWCANPFTKEEVHEAIFQMHPLKAPGPDGLPALFYQKFWHVVGEDVQRLVLDILNHGAPTYQLNKSHIALIPKFKNPSSPKDFRPISPCNVIMKIATKTIANRLKVILPEIVDEEQSAFVKGRLITDNALIAMECFHWLKKKKKGKKGMMALKLDMVKAYDRLEWPFIKATLLSMGFPPHLVDTIMRCISLVSYQILINGQPSRCFAPERGLRQAGRAKIHGIKIARKAPQISHLFFADDSLLFARANLEEADSIFKMEVKTVDTHSKYLGLPVAFGRSKKVIFSLAIDRVWKKLKGWKENFLSRAGKELLIKAVAQAVPNYIMSCYKLPDGTCQEIEAMLAKFWWGSKEDKRKTHWMSWERLSRTKQKGGMGFRGFKEFNKALLGKHCWRLMQEKDSLLERVFKSRYYPRNSFLEATVGYQPSYAWRNILSAKEVVEKGARWRIGNGLKVKIWKDSWLPRQVDFKVKSPNQGLEDLALVSDLIDLDSKQWDKGTMPIPVSADSFKKFVDAGCFLDDCTGWGLVALIDQTNSVVLSMPKRGDCNRPSPSLLKLWELDGDCKWQNISIGTLSP
ncbi:hypothetical protein TSUD_412370 [Trifolium subterraneum]|uniref:Reverse transcriptase domain-containing protein n=1 Tax=Trifolium subterraneum TaxID=3900 RepID=A0A2Z6PKH7_TRISU|nr:hypothetical protein TSUD_412370 [Trifolium subterraneum]